MTIDLSAVVWNVDESRPICGGYPRTDSYLLCHKGRTHSCFVFPSPKGRLSCPCTGTEQAPHTSPYDKETPGGQRVSRKTLDNLSGDAPSSEPPWTPARGFCTSE